MKRKLPLTPAMSECLAAIRALTAGNVAPTYRQIAAKLGLSGPGRTHSLVHSLRDRGYVDFEDGRYRTVVVLDDALLQITDHDLHAAPTDVLMHLAERATAIVAERAA